MPNMVDLYTPRTLAEVVKSTPPVRTFLRDRFFTNVKTFPTKRVDIDIVQMAGRSTIVMANDLEKFFSLWLRM